MMPNLTLSPHLFFLIKGSELFVWDYKHHTQFEISLDHLRVLLDRSFAEGRPDLVKELTEGQILVEAADAVEPVWGWDLLSRMFHFGTSSTMPAGYSVGTDTDVVDSQEYVETMASIFDEMPPAAFSYQRGKPVETKVAPAPMPADLKGLVSILGRRASSRNYVQEPIPLAELLTILNETFRYRPHDAEEFAARGLETATSRRSSPSGGSLQSCEAYLVAKNVAGLAPGVYHYGSATGELGFLHELPAGFNLGSILSGQAFANGLGAAVIMTCRFDKLWWKYKHSRAYRVGILDCGHLSQTLQLMATGFGLQTWPTGAFYDTNLSELLGLPPDGSELPLLLVGIGGHGPPDSFKHGCWPRLDANKSPGPTDSGDE